MGKQVIKINESIIKNIVSESLKRALKENDDLFTRDEFREKHGFNPNWGGDSKPFSHKAGDGVKFYGSEQERSDDELYDSAIETIENSDGNVSFDEWFSTYMYDNDVDRDDAEIIFKKAMDDYNGTSHGLDEAKLNKVVAKAVRKVLKESKKKIRLNEARFDIGGYNCLVNGGNYVYFDKTYNSGEVKRYYYDIRSNKWPEGTPDLRNVSGEELTNELEKAGLNGLVASRIANRVGARPTQTQSPAQNGTPMQRQSSQGGWTRREYDQVNKNDYEINPQAAWQAYRNKKITWNEFERICEKNGVDPSRFTYNSI